MAKQALAFAPRPILSARAGQRHRGGSCGQAGDGSPCWGSQSATAGIVEIDILADPPACAGSTCHSPTPDAGAAISGEPTPPSGDRPVEAEGSPTRDAWPGRHIPDVPYEMDRLGDTAGVGRRRCSAIYRCGRQVGAGPPGAAVRPTDANLHRRRSPARSGCSATAGRSRAPPSSGPGCLPELHPPWGADQGMWPSTAAPPSW